MAPPVLKAGEFYDVKIAVGEIEHPNENGHFFQWIEFYVGNAYWGRFDFAPVAPKLKIIIPLKHGHQGLVSTLRVISRGNLHGLWEGNV